VNSFRAAGNSFVAQSFCGRKSLPSFAVTLVSSTPAIREPLRYARDHGVLVAPPHSPERYCRPRSANFCEATPRKMRKIRPTWEFRTLKLRNPNPMRHLELPRISHKTSLLTISFKWQSRITTCEAGMPLPFCVDHAARAVLSCRRTTFEISSVLGDTTSKPPTSINGALPEKTAGRVQPPPHGHGQAQNQERCRRQI
jgi:hypothetical protein